MELITLPSHKRAMVGGLPVSTAAFYAAVFALAFVVYISWWKTAPTMYSDSGSYMQLAADLSDLELNELHLRTPGYSLLIMLTGSADKPTRALFYASLGMHAASVWLLGVVLYWCGVPRSLVMAVGVLMLLPPYVEPTTMVMSETVAQFSLMVGFAALMKYLSSTRLVWSGLAGLAFGYAALTRPTFQSVSLVLAGLLFVVPMRGQPTWRRRASAAATLVCGAFVLIGGYSIQNYRANGYFGLTPFLAESLTTRTVKFIERLPDEYAPVRELLIKHRNAVMVKHGSGHGAYNYINEARRHDLPELTGLTGVELGRYLLHLNFVMISRAPLQYVHEVVSTLPTFWFPTYGSAVSYPRGVQLVWALMHFVLMACFLLQLVMLTGLVLSWAAARLVSRELPSRPFRWGTTSTLAISAYVCSLAMIGYTMFLSCAVGVGDPRYRIPVDGFVIFATVLGLRGWWDAIQQLPAASAPARYAERTA